MIIKDISTSVASVRQQAMLVDLMLSPTNDI